MAKVFQNENLINNLAKKFGNLLHVSVLDGERFLGTVKVVLGNKTPCYPIP